MTSSFYKDYPKTRDPDDFWGQVKRTVNGQPVPQEQVDLIVDAVAAGLELVKDDVFLDLCCGNGALTTYFFERCAGGLGVDFSEYLIEVARRNFIKRPQEDFLLRDILDFVNGCADPERYTKGCCYGSVAYLNDDLVRTLLSALRRRFRGLRRVFIGNIPDKRFLHSFFGEKYQPGVENDPDSPIGIWRTQDEFRALVETAGWRMEVRHMPKEYYWAHYRYDVILSSAAA
jgi:SAM-dependent methyltransferase